MEGEKRVASTLEDKVGEVTVVVMVVAVVGEGLVQWEENLQ